MSPVRHHVRYSLSDRDPLDPLSLGYLLHKTTVLFDVHKGQECHAHIYYRKREKDMSHYVAK